MKAGPDAEAKHLVADGRSAGAARRVNVLNAGRNIIDRNLRLDRIECVVNGTEHGGVGSGSWRARRKASQAEAPPEVEPMTAAISEGTRRSASRTSFRRRHVQADNFEAGQSDALDPLYFTVRLLHNDAMNKIEQTGCSSPNVLVSPPSPPHQRLGVRLYSHRHSRVLALPRQRTQPVQLRRCDHDAGHRKGARTLLPSRRRDGSRRLLGRLSLPGVPRPPASLSGILRRADAGARQRRGLLRVPAGAAGRAPNAHAAYLRRDAMSEAGRWGRRLRADGPSGPVVPLLEGCAWARTGFLIFQRPVSPDARVLSRVHFTYNRSSRDVPQVRTRGHGGRRPSRARVSRRAVIGV